MKALGIILAGGNNRRMGKLAEKRAIAAMPMAGTYRCIDFALSNMTNSGIKNVAVLTMYNAKSMNDHLRSSKWWNFPRKNGGLFVFAPTLTANNNWWYKGTADSIYQNIEWIKKSKEPYCVIASGNGIYKMDYTKAIEAHVEKDADITIVCTKVEGDATRYGVVKMDIENRILELQEKPLEAESNIISCGIYVIKRELLIKMLEDCAAEDKNDLVNDIIIRYIRKRKVFGYILDSFWRGISSIDNYYDTNMEFLKPDIRKYFFEVEPRIYTRIGDRPPAKYNENTEVKNSLIAVGCIINGSVENSLLYKSCYVGKNTRIKDCIIMNDVYIEDNVQLENCIVESRSTIKAGTTIIGDGEIKVIDSANNDSKI